MQLHTELLKLREKEKQIAHKIIEKLQLMEEGRKYLKLGYSSLFDYLVRGLKYSESDAYRKQSCVRLSREIPEITEKIQTGSLTTTSLGMAFKSLRGRTTQEKKKLLAKIENRTTREVKQVLIQESQSAPEIKVQKTEYRDKVVLRLELSLEQNRKLEKLKALKAHSRSRSRNTNSQSHKGSLEKLLEDLIDRELKTYENTNHKSSRSKNPRFVSKTLRNELLHKADYKCQHPSCEQTHFLQIDHIQPVRHGGLATKENLQVLCEAHNRAKG